MWCACTYIEHNHLYLMVFVCTWYDCVYRYVHLYVKLLKLLDCTFITDATIRFNQLQYSIIEGNVPLRPSLILSNPSSYNITIQVSSTDRTAIVGKCEYLHIH